MQKTITQNTSYFTAALIIQKILSFFYFWYISNQLLADKLGQYVFALSFTGLFAILIDLGLTPVLIREASKDLTRAGQYLKNIIGLKLLLAAGTIIVAALAINFSGKPAEIKILVYLASIIIFLDAFSAAFWGIFRAFQNLFYESIATILVQIIILALGVWFLQITSQIKFLIIALICASVFNFLYSSLLIKLKLKLSLVPAWDQKVIIHFLKIMIPFALAGIFVKIYNTADSVLLSYLASDQAVGSFAICAKTIYSLEQVIPAAFAAALFPVFSNHYQTSKEQLNHTFQRAFFYIIIISLPLGAGLLVLLPQIVKLVWPAYTAVIPTFRIMAASIPFLFLAFPTGYLLNACDRQKNTTINRGIMTVGAIILNIILIPTYSYFGAGITFLIASIIVLILDWRFVTKIVTINQVEFRKIIGKTLLAMLVMTTAIYIFQPILHLLIIIPLAAAVYFGALLLLKGVNLAEAKEIIKAIK